MWCFVRWLVNSVFRWCGTLSDSSVFFSSPSSFRSPRSTSVPPHRPLAPTTGTIPPGTQLSPEYIRLDAKLSKTLSKQTTFTHKGLRDLERAAIDILYSIGSWAADWYVWSVVQHAKKASSEFFSLRFEDLGRWVSELS